MFNGALARLHTTLLRIGKGPRDMVICRCTMLLGVYTDSLKEDMYLRCLERTRPHAASLAASPSLAAAPCTAAPRPPVKRTADQVLRGLETDPALHVRVPRHASLVLILLGAV